MLGDVRVILCRNGQAVILGAEDDDTAEGSSVDAITQRTGPSPKVSEAIVYPRHLGLLRSRPTRCPRQQSHIHRQRGHGLKRKPQRASFARMIQRLARMRQANKQMSFNSTRAAENEIKNKSKALTSVLCEVP